MSSVEITALPNELRQQIPELTQNLFSQQIRKIQYSTDWIFAGLFAVQLVATILLTLWVSPFTWIGSTSFIHQHVWYSIAFGALIAIFPWMMILRDPGNDWNRYVVGIAQVLFSSLLIHITGGRIETHFHVFGSLAFLALYREWKVLIPATLIVAMDHILRGTFWPQSVFGSVSPDSWRWMEHATWVLFEDSVLIIGCLKAKSELFLQCEKSALLVLANTNIDRVVQSQTNQIADQNQLLQRNEARVRNIIDTAYAAFISTDENGIIREWSSRAAILFGFTAHEAIHRNAQSLLQCEHLIDPRFQAEACSISATEIPPYEVIAKRKNGDPIELEVTASKSCREGRCEFYIFLHDVTQRKSEQLQLMHLRKMESIESLATGIAHEINSPTQFIGDNLKFLERSFGELSNLMHEYRKVLHDSNIPIPDEKRMVIEEAEEVAQIEYIQNEIPQALRQSIDGYTRIANITKAMKSFSHPGSNRKHAVETLELIEDSITICRNVWKDIADVSIHIQEDMQYIDCFASELSQVIVNLVVNAAHAIEDRIARDPQWIGHIRIELIQNESEYRIIIEDNGPGIPQDLLPKLFDPFFTTKPVGKGTGQGLAIAHSVIVDRHKGSISVRTELGKGTTFAISIPRTMAVPA